MSPAARPPRRGATRGRTTAAASVPDEAPSGGSAQPSSTSSKPNGRQTVTAALEGAIGDVLVARVFHAVFLPDFLQGLGEGQVRLRDLISQMIGELSTSLLLPP